MKIEVNHIIDIMKKLRDLDIYPEQIEFCQDEVHVHGRCECPDYPCYVVEQGGQCCSPCEGMCECMVSINDITHYKYYINDEDKYNMHYPKTKTLDFDQGLAMLIAMKDYDCIIIPGKITFFTKGSFINRWICEINLV